MVFNFSQQMKHIQRTEKIHTILTFPTTIFSSSKVHEHYRHKLVFFLEIFKAKAPVITALFSMGSLFSWFSPSIKLTTEILLKHQT
jgi:hypothetical protein